MKLSIADWNILVVDDEPDNLSLLEDILAFFDAHVTSVDSGTKAIELLETQSYSLALIDIHMSKISGWEVIKQIRSSTNPAVRNMITVAVTAMAMTGDREKVLQAGFDGYIAKPIDVESFFNTLQEITPQRTEPSSTVNE